MLSHCDQYSYRVDVEATDREHERVDRGGIDPLGVIEHDQDRPFLGGHSEQAEPGRRDREAPDLAIARRQQRDRERLGLFVSESIKERQNWTRQLVEAGE